MRRLDLTNPRWNVSLLPDEARQVLETAPCRLAQPGAIWYAHTPVGDRSNVMEIFHEGVWKTVVRTDLKDDVGTGSDEFKTVDEWRAYYLAKLTYGARLTPSCFAVIDSFSDG